MKNKIAAVVLTATMIGTTVMPAANVFAAETAESEEAVVTDEGEAEVKETKDIVVKDDAAEADFEGVWRLSSLNLFGEAMDAGEYGMDTSFITIQDGKMDIYSAPMYSEETDVKGIDMTFENGKYVVNLDEDLVNKISGEKDEDAVDEDMTLIDTAELEGKLKEITAGNTSALEFQMTEDGQLVITCAINIENDFLTFSTHAIQLLADPSSDSEIEAAKEAASTADDVMLYDDETAEDADTETTDEDVTVNA